ncbi:hypothetical protein K1719_021777 [Acacia pycnantha]|nr:hypothetical protein K1719_021777 [Acacia pycnantha]
MRMPNLLTLEDSKDKELDPKSTPLEVLAFVGEVALQKLEESKQTVEANSSTKENVESNLSKKNGKPLKNKKRKSQLIKDKSERKINRLEISNEKWIEEIKSKKKRGDDSNVQPLPPLPEEFQTRIIEKCGESWLNQLTHIYHKKLFKTDVSRQHSRIFVT